MILLEYLKALKIFLLLQKKIKNLIFYEIKNKGASILKKNLKKLVDEKIKEMKLDEKNNKNTFDGWLK